MDSQDIKIDIPKSAQASQKGDEKYRIRVMPKEFLGKDRSFSTQPQKKVEETPAPPPPPPPPPRKEVAKIPVKKKKSRLPLFLGIFGVLFILLLALGGYIVLQSLQDPGEDVVTPPVVNDTPDDAMDNQDDDPVVIEVRPGVDTDSDGLTDREEALYGTDARNPDSDGDSFNDGNEVFHRFDPNGYAPSTLLDTGAVVEYIDDSYRLTYPRTWNLSLDDSGITMRSTTSANIVFIDQVDDFDSDNVNGFAQTQTKQGYDLYSSTDERTSYVVVGDQTFKFVYDLNGSITIDYVTTFQMIVNSFIVITDAT